MANDPLGSVLRQAHQWVDLPNADEMPDAILLRHFAERQDAAAFAALVRRHGPMVLGVCRRVLGPGHDGDDAFQATFLVLMRKAATVGRPELLANWLYGVAWRVARKARAGAARRPQSSETVSDMPAPEAPSDVEWRDLRPLLDEELQRLPEKYRSPLVLHYLEGKTKDETARHLGWTEGTVSGRLARARDLLRGRLARRGVALSASALGLALSHNAAPASVPVGLLGSTLKLLGTAAGTGEVSPTVAALAEGALRTMYLSKLKIVAALLLTVSLAGIAAGASGLFTPPVPPAADQPAADTPKVKAPVAPADPAQAKTERETLVKDNNAFAFDLHSRLASSPGNLLTSPYSISTALSMTYAGARGDTAAQMAKTMHYSLGQERLHSACGTLVKDLNGEGKNARGYQLNTANALWGQKDLGILDDYLTLTETNYGAGLQLVDFKGNTEAARQAINAWVEKQTREKIKDLIKQGDVSPETRMVLTNAVYLKAEWESKFAKEVTADGDFHVEAGRKVKVPLMHQQTKLSYREYDDFKIVEMPYKGRELSMVIVLPKDGARLADVEKALTSEKLAEYQSKLRSELVNLTLPKFRTENRFLLGTELAKMGMPLAFAGEADFSGITGKRNLKIGNVIHQTFIEVNESGTEAAGATAVILEGMAGRPKEAVEFRADHPFLFLIRENTSGSILFLGRLVEPGK